MDEHRWSAGVTSDIRILDAWEEGQALHPLHRALVLLRLARPDSSIDALAGLSIADRDRGLLELRERLFGRTFEAVASCPACSETLDLAFALDAPEAPGPGPESASLRLGGRETAIRLPSTLDLLEVVAVPAPDREAALASRIAGRRLDPDEVELVERALPAIDPFAEIAVEFECPACGDRGTMPFDIAGYLWDEFDGHAQKVMRDTDVLARTYGWTESEILALPPRRRQVYLELALDG